MKQKVRLKKNAITQLPDTKPGVYVIKNNNGTTMFAGIAKRGQVLETLQSHFFGGENHVPGAWVEFEQLNNLTDANVKLKDILERDNPRYN